ncbi:TPR repeat containing exported protein; Putative periplasmic protein contains a protein prenylyltransferase domain [hydrothermal vent metagenome]|uniref:TPR repeat containing exported protein Putative periplasmic protein contains a protein prenylyltransferase domain n=1 Tax=hydrothermal vent metagenome TaxID=652676 RepID=A0A1W1DHG4_9ZZZZ
MKRLGWVVLIGLFAMQAPFNTLALNVEKIIKHNSKNLKKIKRDNKKLVGQIELLQEQQKYSRKKITELFHLMEYKKSSNVVKETIKRVRDGNRKAKKLYTSARSLLVSGQYNQAIDLFLNYLDIYPDNNYVPDATYWLGRAYTAKGDLHNAKKIFVGFQHDYVSNHKFSNSLYELAVIEHELKEDKRAIQLLKSMIKKFPNHNSIIQAKALLKTIQADQVTKDVTKPESKTKLETTVTK